MYTATKFQTSGRNGVRHARGIAIVDGQRVRFTRFSVEQNGFSAADSFSLELPFFLQDTLTEAGVVSASPSFASTLLSKDTISVQLFVGYVSSDTPDSISTSEVTQVMDGEMDTCEWTFDGTMGESLTLHGRNKTGAMIDTKVTETYPNRTASDIARLFAQEHGLTAVVTQTTEFAGSYYNQRAASIGKETSQWDLLLFLAKRENYIVRVRGRELRFGPYDTVVPDTTPIQYAWGYDVESLTIERSPHAARDVVVHVLSYDRDHKRRIKETATSTTQAAERIGQNRGRAKYELTFQVPGLTRQQAQNRAKRILADYSRKQLLGRMSAAGNVDLSVDRQVRVDGVGKGLSASYYLSRVVHSFDESGGYTSEMSFSTQTDYTQFEADDSGVVRAAGSVNGVQLSNSAAAYAGKQYHANDCGRGVDFVLKSQGIDLNVENPAYAPSYEGVGTKIGNMSDLQPGDLVLTNYGWDKNLQKYDAGHIGIYAGDGKMWNVSTANGYRWSLTGLGSFYMGRRITQ